MFGKKKQLALLCLEAGVERTYQSYVKPIKDGRSDRRLISEEKLRARNMARAYAVKVASNNGVNLLAVLGEDFIDVYVARIIKERKKQ